VSLTILPTQSAVQAGFRAFLLSVLPAALEVIQGQANRIPEPKGPDFVVFTPVLDRRLSTNLDTYQDAVLMGSISGPTLTVTSMALGALAVGSPIFGSGVQVGTIVTGLGTGTGGVGTYQIAPSQTVPSQQLAAGLQTITTAIALTMQCDVHGPGATDNARMLAMVLRDDYAIQAIAQQSPGLDVTPLYTEDPRQAPFPNAEQQIEYRWTVDVHLQINPSVRIPAQFAAALALKLQNVDVPPIGPPS
jgi:hypothetical protein